MKPDFLLWDFNGTLLDDVLCDFRCANDLLRLHGLPELENIDAYREVFGFPVVDYYRRIGFDFDKVSFSEIADEWVAFYEVHSRDCRLMPGAEKVLEAACEAGIKQVVISASQHELLDSQLRQLGIYGYFSETVGISDFYAGSKEQVALAWKDRELASGGGELLFVGDTLHDYEVARAVGARCALYSGGHQSEAILKTTGCPVIGSLEELRGFLR
ncbi:MAG: HAD family hydrolase [Clostridia bacterium]|nr:HAD family hydrolase [Clostridia bacterium]